MTLLANSPFNHLFSQILPRKIPVKLKLTCNTLTRLKAQQICCTDPTNLNHHFYVGSRLDYHWSRKITS